MGGDCNPPSFSKPLTVGGFAKETHMKIQFQTEGDAWEVVRMLRDHGETLSSEERAMAQRLAREVEEQIVAQGG